MQAVDAGDATAAAFTEFDAAFSRHAQAAQAREDARAAAIVEDLMQPGSPRGGPDGPDHRPAPQDGLYDGQAVRLRRRAGSGRDRCWPTAASGRAARPMSSAGAPAATTSLSAATPRRSTGCSASPPASTGQAALANFQASVALANLAHGSTVWGDPDDPDEPGYVIPQQTVELAPGLADGVGAGHVRRRTPTRTCCGHRPGRSRCRMSCWPDGLRDASRGPAAAPRHQGAGRAARAAVSQPEPEVTIYVTIGVRTEPRPRPWRQGVARERGRTPGRHEVRGVRSPQPGRG